MRCIYHQGRFGLAIEPWQHVTRLLPDSSRAWFRLAAAHFHSDRFDEAEAAYRRSIEIDSRAEAWGGLGTVRFYQGRYAEAREAFERAVLLKPEAALSWGNLAAACKHVPGAEHRYVEALDRAIALARDRVEAHPQHAEQWAWLACWLAGRGQDAAAREAVDQALRAGPDNATVLAQAGVACHALGQRDEALRWLGEALRRGYGVEGLKRDPDLAELVDTPEFRMLEAERRERASSS